MWRVVSLPATMRRRKKFWNSSSVSGRPPASLGQHPGDDVVGGPPEPFLPDAACVVEDGTGGRATEGQQAEGGLGVLLVDDRHRELGVRIRDQRVAPFHEFPGVLFRHPQDAAEHPDGEFPGDLLHEVQLTEFEGAVEHLRGQPPAPRPRSSRSTSGRSPPRPVAVAGRAPRRRTPSSSAGPRVRLRRVLRVGCRGRRKSPSGWNSRGRRGRGGVSAQNPAPSVSFTQQGDPCSRIRAKRSHGTPFV